MYGWKQRIKQSRPGFLIGAAGMALTAWLANRQSGNILSSLPLELPVSLPRRRFFTSELTKSVMGRAGFSPSNDTVPLSATLVPMRDNPELWRSILQSEPIQSAPLALIARHRKQQKRKSASSTSSNANNASTKAMMTVPTGSGFKFGEEGKSRLLAGVLPMFNQQSRCTDELPLIICRDPRSMHDIVGNTPKGLLPFTVSSLLPNLQRVRKSSALEYYQLFTFHDDIETQANQLGATPDVVNLPPTEPTVYHSKSDFFAQNAQGFTSSRGAHIQLNEVQDNVFNSDLTIPVPTDGEQVADMNDAEQQHIRDTMLLLLQMGSNQIQINQDEFADSKIGFLYAWAATSWQQAQTVEGYTPRHFSIQVNNPVTGLSRQLYIINEALGDARLVGNDACPKGINTALCEHYQWISEQRQSHQPYANTLKLVNRAWETNIGVLSQQHQLRSDDDNPAHAMKL